MSLPLMEKEFDKVLKKALPYLILAPNNIRDTVADYMKSLWLAMRNDNQTDFDQHCTNINEVIANSDGCTDSFLQRHISDFDGRWSSLDESISKIKKELIDLRKEVGSIKRNKVVKKVKEEVLLEVPQEAITQKKPLMPLKKDFKTIIKPEAIMGQKLELIRNHLKTNKRVTNPEVREICVVTVGEAARLLKKLVKENFVEQNGKSRGTYYEIRE